MNQRRRFIQASAAGIAIGLAGCTNNTYPDVDESDQVDELPRPTLGDETADVRVQVFEDHKCPHCAAFKLNIFPQIEADYIESGEIRYEAWDYPIPVESPGSYYTANAVRYVQDTADDPTAYWEFKDFVYENQESITPPELDAKAAEYGGSEDDAAYARKGVYHPVLLSDRKQGRELGVGGTPSVFVNGNYVNEIYDSLNYANIADAIENEL